MLDYDKDTGTLLWKPRESRWFPTGSHGRSPEDVMKWWNKRFSDTLAFNYESGGYLNGTLFNKKYRAHRIIWWMLFDEQPEVIDHINGNGLDNRLENLRAATKKENSRNQKRPTHNTSGVVGVYWNIGCRKWVASIRVDGVLRHLGVFDEKEEAIKIRKQIETELGFHQNHGSF